MLKLINLGYKTDTHNSVKWLIRAISLEFKPGIIYGIMGPNGSGKSTLLRTMSAIWPPHEGNILWKDSQGNSQSILTLPRDEVSRLISLVPQNPQSYFDFSVEEMVLMGRYAHKRSSAAHFQQEKIEQALSKMGILSLKNRSLLNLSSGEKQRVYIARAIVNNSPILLLDEPTSNLDIHHQLDIWKQLRALANQGKVVVVTVHDLQAAKRFCDEIAVIYEGSCINFGQFEDIMTPPFLRQIFGVEKDRINTQIMYQLPS